MTGVGEGRSPGFDTKPRAAGARLSWSPIGSPLVASEFRLGSEGFAAELAEDAARVPVPEPGVQVVMLGHVRHSAVAIERTHAGVVHLGVGAPRARAAHAFVSIWSAAPTRFWSESDTDCRAETAANRWETQNATDGVEGEDHALPGRKRLHGCTQSPTNSPQETTSSSNEKTYGSSRTSPTRWSSKVEFEIEERRRRTGDRTELEVLTSEILHRPSPDESANRALALP